MKRIWPILLILLLAIVLVVFYLPPADKGCPMEGNPKRESLKELNKLKNRTAHPSPGDFDNTITLEKILEPGDDRERWSSSSAVTLTGYVTKVKSGGPETCNCEAEDDAHHDTHIELSVNPRGRNKQPKLIVEVTPLVRGQMEKQGIDWSTEALKKSVLNKHVKIKGWLMFDEEHAGQSDNTALEGHKTWRTTAWEVHPITSLEIIPGE